MDSAHLFNGTGEHAVAITRIAERQWHALEDDQVVGRGEVSHRPDGRLFLSIDAWHDVVFDRLADAMLADLPRPLYTVVDEADLDLVLQWERAGFAPRRREWEYVVPTDPRITGLASAPPPRGVTTLAVGEAEEAPLRALDRVIRDEIEATVGWQEMPAEVLSGPDGPPRPDPATYAVAAWSDQYVGLVRVAPLPRQPRIGLIAVRSDQRRRGIARALLAEVLGSAHRRGIATASADVNQSNGAAIALFEGVGARRAGSNLELVLR
ncbi:GNAT family N-acetyltransferase [Micromonospora sp. WMMD558]|uniref:GNAT family N-acetyltransferase n=1 Tax=unclassified Micromonospora TaxID=2617518 RepID=UPI0012B503B1|nr:GNAT family N-acetyltransferase [Micromonospora sp. WMMC415]QGN48516.1 GNAT family N-acetyltransferase [Micromonospora sp. WMMC415]